MFITETQYQFIKNQEAFRHLPTEVFDELVKDIRFRKLPKKQIIFFEGDERDKLFLLYNGYIRIEQYDMMDTFSYWDYIKPNTLFPYGGMFCDDCYYYSATAITDVDYFFMPTKAYENAVSSCILQMEHICRKLSKILRFQELRLRNLVTSSASDRVVQTLAILMKDLCCEDKNVLPIPLTAIELAKESATTRETTSSVLTELKNSKKIDYNHKQITYLDKEYFLEFLE